MLTKTDQRNRALAKKIVQKAASDVFEDLHLHEIEMQSILQDAKHLESAVRDEIRVYIKASGGLCRHLRDRVVSDFTYPTNYVVRDFAEQMDSLQVLSRNLRSSKISSAMERLPNFAEGYFAIPPWWMVADSYDKAVRVVLKQLAINRPVVSWQPRFRYQPVRRSEWLYRSCKRSWNEIMAVPAQFGLRHRGRSFRCAEELYQPHEFGLGAFAACCMLLTHPERLVKNDDLQILCAGDVCTWAGNRVPYVVPFLRIQDDMVELSELWVDHYSTGLGSITGFTTR